MNQLINSIEHNQDFQVLNIVLQILIVFAWVFFTILISWIVFEKKNHCQRFQQRFKNILPRISHQRRICDCYKVISYWEASFCLKAKEILEVGYTEFRQNKSDRWNIHRKRYWKNYNNRELEKYWKDFEFQKLFLKIIFCATLDPRLL